MLRTIGRGINAALVLGALCWAYGQAFDHLARRSASPPGMAIPIEEWKGSATSQDATALAETCFGHGHWTTDPSRSKRYYKAARGYWIYAGDYETGEDNQKVTLTPFALIWRSEDGASIKSVLANQATLTLDRPYISEKGGTASPRVARAKIEGDVVIRDHKKTLDDQADDLVFSLPELEFDDAEMKITSPSPLRLVDQGVVMTGVGLEIALIKGAPEKAEEAPAKAEPRPQDATYGYKGVQYIEVKEDIRIIVVQSGRTAAVPVPAIGPSKPGPAGARKDDGPLELTADGPMKLEPPATRAPRRPGEPELPPEPTIALFEKVVKVRKGPAGRQDELDCDRLHLVLVPTKESPRAIPERMRNGALLSGWSAAGLAGPVGLPGALVAVATLQPAPGSSANGSVGGNLALQRAEATGHAVWVRSFEQAFTSKGRYLLHEKSSDPAKPDRTHLKGNESEPLFIEKLEYADASRKAVKTVFTMHAADLALHDSAHNGQPDEVISMGPGRIEERPGLDAPPVRTVAWRDRLRSVPDGPAEQGRRVVLLTGQPRATDPKQGDLSAKRQIMLWLVPSKPKAPATAQGGARPAAAAESAPNLLGSGDSYRAERMQALDDVTFEGPGQSLKARKQLDLVLKPMPEAQPAADGPAPTPQPAAGPLASNAPAQPQPKPGTSAPQAGQPKPEEPPWDVLADTVWAQAFLAQGPEGKTTAKLDRAYLRGEVEVHQAAAKGKARGLDAHGTAIDLESQKDNMVLLRLSGTDPAAKSAAAEGQADPQAKSAAWAKVAYENFLIEGAILSVSQADELAYVKGPGRLTQFGESRPVANSVVPTSHALPAAESAPARTGGPAAAAVSAKPTPPKVLTWTDWMRFTGRELTSEGALRPAKAAFSGQVKGDLGDSAINAAYVEAYFDRIVPFNRGGPRDGGSGQEQPKVVYIKSTGKVALVHYVRDEKTGKTKEVIRVDGPQVTYGEDTDIFQVKGQGVVRHYRRPGAQSDLAGIPSAPERPSQGQGTDKEGWELVRISFLEGMEGRVGGGDGLKSLQARGEVGGAGSTGRQGPRQATFFDEVDLIQAKVPDTNHDIDPESPPPDYRRLNADQLVVESLAPPPEAGSQAKDRLLARAFGRATARTSATSIQGATIHYDSLKETFHVYGGPGRDVIVVQQKSPGQPASYGESSALVYNLRTQALNLIDPRGGQLVDSGDAKRYVPEDPNGPPRPPARPGRPRFPAPTSRDRERAGFGDGGTRYSNGMSNGNGGFGS